MAEYKTLRPLQFSGGLLWLSPEQAGKRAEYLEEKKKGQYLVIGTVQFKSGEVIGLDAVPKAYADDLEPVGKPKETPPAKAK